MTSVAKNIYFNKDHPENHTIKMQNFKLNQVMIHEDCNWVKKQIRDTLPKMVKKSQKILANHYYNSPEIMHKDIDENDHVKQLQLGYLLDENDSAFKKSIYSIKSIIQK